MDEKRVFFTAQVDSTDDFWIFLPHRRKQLEIRHRFFSAVGDVDRWEKLDDDARNFFSA
jgi:hypothetical protein